MKKTCFLIYSIWNKPSSEKVLTAVCEDEAAVDKYFDGYVKYKKLNDSTVVEVNQNVPEECLIAFSIQEHPFISINIETETDSDKLAIEFEKRIKNDETYKLSG